MAKLPPAIVNKSKAPAVPRSVTNAALSHAVRSHREQVAERDARNAGAAADARRAAEAVLRDRFKQD